MKKKSCIGCRIGEIIGYTACAAGAFALGYVGFKLIKRKTEQENSNGRLLRVNYKFSREF